MNRILLNSKQDLLIEIVDEKTEEKQEMNEQRFEFEFELKKYSKSNLLKTPNYVKDKPLDWN